MNSVKRIMSIALVFLLLISVFSVSAAAVQPKQTEQIEECELFTYLSSAPDENNDIKALAEYIYNKLTDFETEIDISGYNVKHSKDSNGYDLIDYILNGYYIPELFHIGSCSKMILGEYIIKIYPDYNSSKEDFEKMSKDFEDATEELLSGIKGNNQLNDVEKALLIHDRLILHNEYDYNYSNDAQRLTYTAYGAMVNRKSVCQGYAKAYMYLLKQVGIKSELCDSTNINHMWNIVYINNEPYHVDLTWDDPSHNSQSGVIDVKGYVGHNSFLISTSVLEESHFKSYNKTLDCDTSPVNTRYDNAFWRDTTSAFHILNGTIYYIDQENSKIRTLKNGSLETFFNFSSYWLFTTPNFAKLDIDGDDLLFSGIHNIYRLNTATKTTSKLIANLPLNTNIYSFDFDGEFITYYYILGNQIIAAEPVRISDHNFTKINSDGTYHWKECVNCGEVDELTKEEHIGTATCTQRAICTYCNTQYGDLADHKPVLSNNIPSNCSQVGWQGRVICSQCNAVLQNGTALKGNHTDANGHWESNSTHHYQTCSCGHTFGYVSHTLVSPKTKKATTSKNGSVTATCKDCDAAVTTQTIQRPKTFKLSSDSYTYNGKAKKPTVTVKDAAGKTISKSNYTVTYASGRKAVGKYKVTIKFKGSKYSGTKTLYFKINPVKTTVKKVTASKKSLKVSVTKKKSSQVSGYQVQYSLTKKFTSAKIKNLSGYKKTSLSIKSLKTKKTYYVRVRTFKTVKGVKYYSAWSTVKSKKTK